MFAALVTKLLEFVLQVLCFHRPLPTPAQITLKALKTRRRNLVSQGDAMVDIPPELSFDRVVYPQPGEETPPVSSSLHVQYPYA